MNRTLLFCTLLLIAGSFRNLSGQIDPVSVSATVNRDTITVGDHFELKVTASYDQDTAVQMPGADADLGDFELLDHRYSPITEDDQGSVVASTTYTLTAFTTGTLEVPSLKIHYRTAGDEKEGSVSTEPLSITVESVIKTEAKDIRDIKPPLNLPRDWLPLILAFAGGAALVILALIFWRRSRWSKSVEAETSEPPLPPHIEAFRALNRLGKAGLLDRGEIARYHIEVSEIIRRYFSGRFGIDALEMTSREVLLNLPRHVSRAGPENLLSQCDLVKFAKLEPDRKQSEAILETAYEIVETTKPRFASQPNSDEGTAENSPEPAEGS